MYSGWVTTRAGVSLAERKRQLVSDELTGAALRLLAQKGFDAVTIDEIVAAAGVSKRTFFRYFASKEDVVIQFLAEMGTDMRAELAGRPAQEPPSVALRHTIWVSIDACAGHADQALRVVQLILGTPSLLARFLERQAQWRDELATEVADRLGLAPETDLYPQLAAGMALAAFGTVLQRWSDSDGAEDPATLTDRAFAIIAPALDAAA
ncbi:TetR family transcriptional regulator [Streptomyces globisporus]|uniref:TetR family transcriptional regulator n=1 Tax=Streptomyces TaxID=1883 RepID=UPI00190CD667|nr:MULTISPECIES: TetR family transcriptional regulator [unclassified Streptomyces]MBK3557197.1 TetR family transcriptional regulator [Streptomyces sp. MBT56]MBK3600358.1 TetR family transcriptional regulator [Streptomyces sp. MBT54]MBK3618952.1 TetR family transcriptional regulator [Streptomyces sp. MBT98]MBK6041232.1 TetR family transcriptional regulator [Streptomyces sp. MBT55]